MFGSCAKGIAEEDSDLDFVMDKGNLHGLIQYCALINELEKEFGCHVDLISKVVQIMSFLIL